ncbi:hypothetical protein B9Z55_010592 [Caenorhabditis nigoni]|uniref:NADH dehydrogenase [ubiquinone] 1 alpha subcomplex subunit 8 n=1 Tax=Caenorhabditis nigoni TaxID=1611254 RepID=A0A2G5UGL7_9PELO|nr:hypothetical protein B9Z55_010592 [Caenorhabditis nigoni]
MSLTKDTHLPSDEELTVPQEISLSTPWLKAVAPYMAKHCEKEANEFMLRRKESEDPRAVLKEGAALTACGVNFLQSLKRSCLPQTQKLAECVDQGSAKLYMSNKLHVYDSATPAPEVKLRDYKAEAAKVLNELPAEYHLRKDYRKYNDWRYNITES